MARSHFSYEKRRKELEKIKKKEAKRQAKVDRKAAIEAGEQVSEPVVMIDEFGNAVEIVPESDSEPDPLDENDAPEEPDPA